MSKIDLLKFAKHLGLFDLDIQYITSDIELLYKLMNKINEVTKSHNDLSDAVTEINNFINNTILVDIDELQRTMLLKTQKVEITLENNVFKMGNTVLNFKDIRDLLKVSPNFVYVLHGDRAYLCSYIQDDEGLKEIRFQSVINSDNRVKSSCIYIISTDGIDIYNTTVSDINSENQSNKVEEVTASTKDSTGYYPSNKAMTNYVNERIDEAVPTQESIIENKVDRWLDNHPEATTTVLDGSITEDKLNSALIEKIESGGYITDNLGNKYTLIVDNGTIKPIRLYEDYDQNVLLNYQIKNDVLTELLTDEQFTDIAVTGKYTNAVYDSADHPLTNMILKRNLGTLPDLFNNNGITFELVISPERNRNKIICLGNISNLLQISGEASQTTDTNQYLSQFNSSWVTNSVLPFRGSFNAIRNSLIIDNYPFIGLVENRDYYAAISFSCGDDGKLNGGKFFINGISVDINYNTNVNMKTALNTLNLFIGNVKTKMLRLHNKALSVEEMTNNMIFNKIDSEPALVYNPEFLRGLTGLGSSLAVASKSNEKMGYAKVIDTPVEAGEQNYFDRTFTNYDYAHTDNSADNSIYTALSIVNKRDTVYLDRKTYFTAYPFPVTYVSNQFSKFDIEWSVSDNSKGTIINGLFIPKSTGNVTITAKLRGTNITDSFTTTIISYEKTVFNTYKASGDIGTEGLRNMINVAKMNGYDRLLIEEGSTISLTPPDDPIIIPDNFTVDFNNNKINIIANNKTVTGYTMFRFENCKNSFMVNGNMYGERYGSSLPESEFSEQVRFLEFGDNAENCWIKNFNFYSPCGFNVVTSARWHYWNGLPDRTNGTILYTEFNDGKLNDQGNITSASGWITSNLKDFSTEENYNKFWFGNAYGMALPFIQRLYDVAFYDDQQRLIEVQRNNYVFQQYKVPEGTKYFRFSIYDTKPTSNKNTGDDVCVVRMGKGVESIDCGMYNCNAYNTASGIYSGIGESENFQMIKCYSNANGKKNAWVYDLEDGWWNMRHSVIDGCMFMGISILRGHGISVNNSFSNYKADDNTEMMNIVNSYIKTYGMLTPKFGNKIEYCYYNSISYDSNKVDFNNNTQRRIYLVD